MITAQDIQEKAFERAGKGYNMEQVDEFLDELAADFNTMNKENAALKGKLKVLVQKVDEYRQTEDSMRLALLSAQKLSSQIEAEARSKADALVADAQKTADDLTRAATEGIANEEAKLDEAKKATTRFFDHMRAVCQKQIEFYDKLSQMQLVGGEAPAQEAEPESEPEPEPAPAPMPEPEPEPEPAPAPADPEPILPLEEEENPEQEEPTRLYPAGGAGQRRKKKRSFDDFSFDDDI